MEIPDVLVEKVYIYFYRCCYYYYHHHVGEAAFGGRKDARKMKQMCWAKSVYNQQKDEQNLRK